MAGCLFHSWLKSADPAVTYAILATLGAVACHDGRVGSDYPAPRQRWAPPVPEPATAPAAVLGGVVPMDLVLARTCEMALVVAGISAYRQGFRVLFSGVSRRATLPEEPPQLEIRYAGGRPVYVTAEGATAGPLRYEMACWVWPLPPPGAVVFAGRWPAGGVPESVVAIDAAQIRAAAARSVPLWP